jgi:hypothetical protein
MNRKYITTQILLACKSKAAIIKPDIHLQLEQTLAERRKLMQELERIARSARVIDLYLEIKAA